MILDSIILENFGAYGGRQEAVLTPGDGRPIILFGGMNGGGKTTLLDAVQLAFYGPKARLSNRGRLGYRDYLRESIHHGVDPGEGADTWSSTIFPALPIKCCCCPPMRKSQDPVMTP